MDNVLFVAPHPDDETLGCGGTILKHKNQGDNIYWLILTKANPKITSIQNIENIQKQYIQSVSEKYNFNKIFHLDFLTTELDIYPIVEIIGAIKKVFDLIQPNIVYLPNRSDVHSDHKIIFKATYACTKNFRAPYVKKILMYETLSETEFSPPLPENAFMPNLFNDITPYMERKIEIMKLFTTEQMEKPFPRAISSIKALNRFRGSRIGVEYAEAFMQLLDIN